MREGPGAAQCGAARSFMRRMGRRIIMLERTMHYILSLFLVASFCQPLYSHSYADSLNAVIDEKTAALGKLTYKVNKITHNIRKNITTQVSLQDVEDLLDNKHSVALLFCNEMQLSINEQLSQDAVQSQQQFKDLKFALGAKLYMHYLACAKQKMLYQAVKNYDALNYWQNEKFCQSQSFFQKGIFRSLSGSDYTEQIMNNIQLLQEVTRQTNLFLGLMLHNQQALQKATTLQEFEQSLMQATRLQDGLCHAQDQVCDICDIAKIVKKSIDQVSQLSSNLSEQYAQCQMPSHAVRHWKGYTFTTATALAAAFIYVKYGDQIVQSSQGFFNQHVKDALNRNIEMLAGRMKAPQFPTTQEENMIDDLIEKTFVVDVIESSELEAALELKIGSGLSEFLQNGGSVQKFFEENPNLIWIDTIMNSKWTDPITPDKYEKGSRSWVTTTYNVYNGISPRKPLKYDSYWKKSDGSDGIFLQWWKYSHGVTDADVAIANAYEQTVADHAAKRATVQDHLTQLHENGLRDYQNMPFDVNTPEGKRAYADHHYRMVTKYPLSNAGRLVDLGAWTIATQSKSAKDVMNTHSQDVHAMLGLATLIPIVTLIGGSLFASKSVYNSVAYQPIRTLVRRLEVYLNEIFYEEVTFDKEGHIYFLTEQLKLNINVLTIEEQKLIIADIEALQAPSLDYVQKTNVVQRMYRTYPCLIPARV